VIFPQLLRHSAEQILAKELNVIILECFKALLDTDFKSRAMGRLRLSH
jgi:hypothetical protein